MIDSVSEPTKEEDYEDELTDEALDRVEVAGGCSIQLCQKGIHF